MKYITIAGFDQRDDVLVSILLEDLTSDEKFLMDSTAHDARLAALFLGAVMQRTAFTDRADFVAWVRAALKKLAET